MAESGAGHNLWTAHLQGDPLPWLLEPRTPSARYLALRHLLNRSEEDPDVVATRAAILDAEPAASILAAQWPDGYWVKPDRGYSPKYRATVWQISFLAQLGAPRDERVRRACEFVWRHSRRDDGLFTPHRRSHLRDLALLNGCLIWALTHFGYGTDPRMAEVQAGLAALPLDRLLDADALPAVVWLARGLQALPEPLPSALAAFLQQSLNLIAAHLPPPRGSPWWQLSFPLADTTDVVAMLSALLRGQRVDGPGVKTTVEGVLERQDGGRWRLDAVPGKTWASFGKPGEFNKWVTIRVLRVLGRFP
jgi:hypothetical protein